MMIRRLRCSIRLGATVLAMVLASAAVAGAAQGDCSQPVTTGSNPTASDCLFILKVAVGTGTCDPQCICAPKGTLPTTATDALVCLKKAVGQTVTLMCPCEGTTTTTPSSSTSTTLPGGGATITIVNQDSAGEGFNDPSPRSPVGGNDGTTLGQQRLNVFEFAANIWAGLIASGVEILVAANFDPLTCNSNGAVLGAAGAGNFARNFPNAPLPDTWYPIGLANRFANQDLDPGVSDINATFNSSIGTTCPFPNVWYYGLDASPPQGTIDLATVVLHELGHGLGFATIVDLASGQKALGIGGDDAYMVFLEDHSTTKTYPTMSDGERVTASKDSGDLHWTGAAVVGASDRLSAGRHASGHVQMYAPDPQEPGSSVSHFDKATSPNELMEPSYTGPLHSIGLTRELFDDIGWDTIP